MHKYLAEVLGTFVLVLAVSFTGNPIAIGLALAVSIYAFGSYSGGHFNPAVSIANLILKKLSLAECVKYILAQFVGAILALGLYRIIFGKFFVILIPQTSRFINAFAVETILAFIFVLVILNVVMKKASSNNQYYGFVIGIVIAIGALAFGKISSGVFNPAIGVTSILLDLQNVIANVKSLAVYIFAPILGGVLATLLFDYMEELSARKRK